MPRHRSRPIRTGGTSAVATDSWSPPTGRGDAAGRGRPPGRRRRLPIRTPARDTVIAGPAGAVVASFRHVYAVGPSGTQWHTALPAASPIAWCDAAERTRGDAAARLLGVTPGADSQIVRSAYRRLARATHPDR